MLRAPDVAKFSLIYRKSDC